MSRGLVALAGAAVLSSCGDVPTPLGPDEMSGPALSRTAQTVEVIVVLNDEFAPGGHAANAAQASAIARGMGVAPRFAYGSAVFGFAASVSAGRLNGLRNDPRVAYVDFDGPVSIPDRATAQPCWVSGTCSGGGGQTLPWGVDRIDADLNPNTAAGTHVYIIDTGIDSDHPDLEANIGNGFAVEKCKGRGCNFDWDDDNDHGTHVSGTVAAIDNDIDVIGVAPAVTLHAVKVLSNAGSGSRSGVIQGIDWVTNEVATRGEAAAANMSLGGSGSKTGTCSSSGYIGTDSYHAAMCNAAHVGVVFAVAAGNDGADAEGFVPAAFDDAVVTVSATNISDQWESWSNWGDNTASWTTNVSVPVALGAPGGNILSTLRGGGTTTMSGTSMASPHVAGTLALFLSSTPQAADYSAFENARSALLANAEDTSAFGNEDASNPHDEDFTNAEGM